MIDINVANFITVGGISIFSVVLLTWLLQWFGINTDWLQGLSLQG
jgi:hypothetical protein